MKEKFGDRLRELRQKSGLSTRRLADKLDISNACVCMWETGNRYPKADSIIVLADIFGVTTDYLLGRTEE